MAICSHLDLIADTPPSGDGCLECLQIGAGWVHLRRCATCGQVGCCDSSPNKHASKHARSLRHPIMQSFEPGEEWFWCEVDQVAFEIPEAPSYSHPGKAR